MTTLTGDRIAAEGLRGWVHLLGGLQTRIPTGDLTAGLAVVAAIGAAAVAAGGRPGIDLRHDHVDVRLTSLDGHGVTSAEIGLARTITGIAREAGFATESSSVARLELALDTPDRAAVRPFWVAVLGGGGDDNEVADPADNLPAVWFQQSGDEESRQRWHPDVWVEPAQVRPRLDAALAAGGRLVSDAEAPSFWVLADPDGNKVCLCTWQGRGSQDV
jgi:4a-hydroxytetrahydrobiopterin dehydratase